MSSSGINAINSGPLIIRTYLNSSINNTYVSQEFDVPVSTNRLLITSTGGCLVPSDSITISSMNVSSLYASSISSISIFTSSLLASSISTGFISSLGGNISSLLVSSFYANSINFSTVITSTIGIGTSNPQTALDMIGTANISSITSTITYETPGTYPIALPPGVKSIEFEMIGAGGLGDTIFTGVGGGTGGYMKGTIELPSNLTYLNVVVGAAGSGGTPAGASYINGGTSPSPATALLAIAGAGGSGTTGGLGGEGGGGIFSTGGIFIPEVAPGGDGVGAGNGEGGSLSFPTIGGVGGSGCISGSGVNGDNRPFPEDYEQALGGAGVPGNIYAGGSGYAGGGSGCGGGGGSSYYNTTYATLVASESGNNVTTELPGFGRSNQGGKVVITINYAAINTNGDIVARNICAKHITISSIFSTTPPIIYSTAGTYTSIAIPRGTTSIEFEMIGAGGSNPVIASPAGVGGYIKGNIIIPTGISTIKVQVGASGGTIYTPSGASYITVPTTGPLFAMAGAGGNTNIFATGLGGGGGGSIVDINGVYPGENGSPCTAPGICGGGGSVLVSVNGGTPGYRCDGNLAFPGQPGGIYANNYEESPGGAGGPAGFGFVIVAGGNGYAGGGSGCGGGGGSSYANPTYTNVYTTFQGSAVPPFILSGTYGRPNQDGYVSIQFISGQNSLTMNGDILCNNIQANGTITVPNGSVIIGSGAGNYPLEVTATPTSTVFKTGWRYGNGGGGVNPAGGIPDGINVKTTAGIWAPIFYATSDRRIKREISSIRDDEALQVVRKIDPVRYKYIDAANRHNEQEYGFIAQDVKSVLPYAVRTETDFVPNVYDVAEFTKIDEHASMITLRNKTMEHIRVNDLIKLIDLKEQHIILTVSDINYNYFVVDTDLTTIVSKTSLTMQDIANGVKTNTVFVYGTQVSDLHILNKEAIYSVSIAAVQELDRVIQQQDSIIAEQGQKIKSLEDKMELLLLDKQT